MNERNPYAPPKADVFEVAGTSCTRDGKLVIVMAGSDLPRRCIVCNAPAQLPIKTKKVYWHSQWIYLLFLINALLYVVVGVIARKSFKVSAGLCERHTAQRKRRVLLLLGYGLGASVVGGILMNQEQELVAVCLFVVALVSLVGSALTARRVYARKITKEYARLAGCKEPFLASLK